MRRASISAAIGAAIAGAAGFIFGAATGAHVYRGQPGDVTGATLGLASVYAILGATAGAFFGAGVAVLAFFLDDRKPAPGPEEDYRDPPTR